MQDDWSTWPSSTFASNPTTSAGRKSPEASRRRPPSPRIRLERRTSDDDLIAMLNDDRKNRLSPQPSRQSPTFGSFPFNANAAVSATASQELFMSPASTAPAPLTYSSAAQPAAPVGMFTPSPFNQQPMEQVAPQAYVAPTAPEAPAVAMQEHPADVSSAPPALDSLVDSTAPAAGIPPLTQPQVEAPVADSAAKPVEPLNVVETDNATAAIAVAPVVGVEEAEAVAAIVAADTASALKPADVVPPEAGLTCDAPASTLEARDSVAPSDQPTEQSDAAVTLPSAPPTVAPHEDASSDVAPISAVPLFVTGNVDSGVPAPNVAQFFPPPQMPEVASPQSPQTAPIMAAREQPPRVPSFGAPAPTAAPNRGLRKSSPTSTPQKLPLTAPAAAMLMAWRR